MKAEIIHNGIVLKLEGTPEEIAATARALATPTQMLPYIAPVPQQPHDPMPSAPAPVLPYPDIQWIPYVGPVLRTKLEGCICPDHADGPVGISCPAHVRCISTSVLSDFVNGVERSYTLS